MQAFAWKLTIDKKPVFLDLSHRNTINDNEVLCVGCVLTANILGTCSMNAIFFSRVWFASFSVWALFGYFGTGSFILLICAMDKIYFFSFKLNSVFFLQILSY